MIQRETASDLFIYFITQSQFFHRKGLSIATKKKLVEVERYFYKPSLMSRKTSVVKFSTDSPKNIYRICNSSAKYLIKIAV